VLAGHSQHQHGRLQRLGAASLPDIEVPAAAGPGRPAPKDWTVLVYVSARNNLGLEAIKDVNEMEAAGSTSRLNVVAELGRIVTEPVNNPFSSVQEPVPPQADWTGSRRFLMVKDSDPLRINSPVLSHFTDADMGDWRHLAEFIAWGKANYPAKKYLLIVGGHGSGWRGVKPPAGAAKGISYDEPSGHHISPEELALAIKAGAIEILETKIEGDKATVRYRNPEGKEETDALVKEDGEWKLDFNLDK